MLSIPLGGSKFLIQLWKTQKISYTLGTAYSGPYGVDAIPYNATAFLWPIPQQEIKNNPTLAEQQNPGW